MNQNFTVVAGDSLQFRVNFINSNQEPSDITFTAKNKGNDSEPTIYLSLDDGITKVEDMNSYDFYIPSTTTSDLELLNYVYQIKVAFGGDIETIVEGKLVITQEV